MKSTYHPSKWRLRKVCQYQVQAFGGTGADSSWFSHDVTKGKKSRMEVSKFVVSTAHSVYVEVAQLDATAFQTLCIVFENYFRIVFWRRGGGGGGGTEGWGGRWSGEV